MGTSLVIFLVLICTCIIDEAWSQCDFETLSPALKDSRWVYGSQDTLLTISNIRISNGLDVNCERIAGTSERVYAVASINLIDDEDYCFEFTPSNDTNVLLERSVRIGTNVDDANSCDTAPYDEAYRVYARANHPRNDNLTLDIKPVSCGFPDTMYQVTVASGPPSCAGDPSSNATSTDSTLSLSTCYTGTVNYSMPLEGTLTCLTRIEGDKLRATADRIIFAFDDPTITAGIPTRFYCAELTSVDGDYESFTLSLDTSDIDNPMCKVDPVATSPLMLQMTEMGCQRKTCQNGGSCVEDKCVCLGDYTGEWCETTPCDSKPCQNGASCSNDAGSYRCTCLAGYTGLNCESLLPGPCMSEPCANGGTCVPGSGGTTFTCNCAPGFTGSMCASALPPTGACVSDPCENGGSCVTSSSTTSGFTCNCLTGYTGDTCQTPPVLGVDPCESSPCLNMGTCYGLTNTTYSCKCPDGATGERCETMVPCELQCRNSGRCVLEGMMPKCQCRPGFAGELCDRLLRDCRDDPAPQCGENGVCGRLRDSDPEEWICGCSDGWTGPRCEDRDMSVDWTALAIALGVIGAILLVVFIVLCVVCCNNVIGTTKAAVVVAEQGPSPVFVQAPSMMSAPESFVLPQQQESIYMAPPQPQPIMLPPLPPPQPMPPALPMLMPPPGPQAQPPEPQLMGYMPEEVSLPARGRRPRSAGRSPSRRYRYSPDSRPPMRRSRSGPRSRPRY